jgi:hypothetical protein
MCEQKKVCTKCGVEKPLSEYGYRSKTFDNRNQRCKVCSKECQKEQYTKHREKRLESKREYSKKNKEHRKEYYDVYSKKNEEQLKIKKKEYYIKNLDVIKEKRKKYYDSNKDKQIQLMKVWHENNKERFKRMSKTYYENNRKTIIEKKKQKLDDPLIRLRLGISSLIRNYLLRRNVIKNNRTIEILGCDIKYFYSYIESKFVDGMNWENRNEWHLDHIIPICIAKNEYEIIKLNHYTNFRPLWKEENLSKSGKVLEEHKWLMYELLGEDFVLP